MGDAKRPNGAMKIGPPWNRTVFDPANRRVRHRDHWNWAGRTCNFDDIRGLVVREYIARDEEEQLLNIHPEVQKRPRDAELWVEMKDGSRWFAASLDRAGLLLEFAHQAAALIGVPVQAERTLIAPTEPPKA